LKEEAENLPNNTSPKIRSIIVKKFKCCGDNYTTLIKCSIQYTQFNFWVGLVAPYRSLADDKLPVYIPGTRMGKALELYETEHIKMKCVSDHPAVTEALRLVLFIVQWAKWYLHI